MDRRQTEEEVDRQYHRMDRGRGDRQREKWADNITEWTGEEERRQTEEKVSRQYHRMDRRRGEETDRG
jgi:hypothetical protein